MVYVRHLFVNYLCHMHFHANEIYEFAYHKLHLK